jgi:hypothetical protein
VTGRRTSRLALVFALGAGSIVAVAAVARAVFGDDAWSWAETAVRAVGGGFTALLIAYAVPPKRLRGVGRAVTSAIYRGRLPQALDVELWRAALDHQRSFARVWATVFPGVFALAAAACVLGGVLGGPEARGLAWGLAPVLLFAAVVLRVVGRRRLEAVTDLLSELDERDVRAG